jgi:hypothetical protein
MNYEDLLNKGQIKRFSAAPTQAASRLALAKRDIKAASAMMSIDHDWAFSMAYKPSCRQQGLLCLPTDSDRPPEKGNTRSPLSLLKSLLARNSRMKSTYLTR